MASGDEVYMDIPAVHNFAKMFGTVGEVLEGISKTLQALSMILKSTAFIGLVGGAVVIQFIEMIKPQIDNAAKKCEELNKDVEAAVQAYERGDAQGATKFH